MNFGCRLRTAIYRWFSELVCPAPLTQNCPVDCVGSWGACAGPPLAQFKTYTWTTPPLNGGSAATCGYPNGQTDNTGCDLNGTCGTANGTAFAYAPTANFCATGNFINMAGVGPWTWTCQGNGGTDAACSASKMPSPKSFSMLCGSMGCSVAAWNQAKFWVGSLAAAGVPVNVPNITTAASASLVPLWNACEHNKWYAGTPSASVSDGNVTWSVDVAGTEDLYLNPYSTNWGACTIIFTVTYF